MGAHKSKCSVAFNAFQKANEFLQKGAAVKTNRARIGTTTIGVGAEAGDYSGILGPTGTPLGSGCLHYHDGGVFVGDFDGSSADTFERGVLYDSAGNVDGTWINGSWADPPLQGFETE